MRTVIIILIALCLYSCSGGGSGSGGGSAVYPGMEEAPLPSPVPSTLTVEGFFCDVQATNFPIDGMKEAARYFDEVCLKMENHVGKPQPGKLLIIFEDCPTGYFSSEEMMNGQKKIHLSETKCLDYAVMHMYICHEFAHACHLYQKWSRGIKGFFLLDRLELLGDIKDRVFDTIYNTEGFAMEAEYFCNTNNPPGKLTDGQYNRLETATYEDTDAYVIWGSWGYFLTKQYGENIIYNAVNSSYIGREEIEKATGENWQTIIKRWRNNVPDK